MITLNRTNDCDLVCDIYERRVVLEFPDQELIGVIMGVAYGGDIERVAKTWGHRGVVYGYDTFEDLHPKHLAEDISHFEAQCMQYWYDMHGTDLLNIDSQRKELERLGIKNAFLIKGEVHEQSCRELEKIHYAFLDMDILASMEAGYQAVKDKIVPGGYLLLHDVINNIDTLTDWYDKIKKDPMWEVVEEPKIMAVLKKKNELSNFNKTSDEKFS